MSWFSRLLKSKLARSIAKIALELGVGSMDKRVSKPLIVGLVAAQGVANELGLEKEKRALSKLYRYMGEPEIPEED